MGDFQKEITITVEDLELIRIGTDKRRDDMLKRLKKYAGCNGFVNRATWTTHRNFVQDKALYRAFAHKANHILAGQGSVCMNKSVPFQDQALMAVSYGLKDYFKDAFERPEIDSNSKDLLRNVYASVAWEEIGTSFLSQFDGDRRSTDLHGN